MSLAVALEGVSKSYKGREVLKGVTCGFKPGEISVVLGPNGSGKTTLLRIIARLEAPDAGTVAYSEGSAPARPGLPLMRRMTLVSQSPVLFNTTLYNNIAYGLRVRGLPEGEVRSRVDDALELGGLKALARSNARLLSGGEAQRAAMVRAWALRPELILLDEPTANLDPSGVALMERLIRRMKDEQGAAVALVTHNLFQARRLSDRVYFIYEGELVESGDSDAFFGSPQKGLTRGFLSGEVVY